MNLNQIQSQKQFQIRKRIGNYKNFLQVIMILVIFLSTTYQINRVECRLFDSVISQQKSVVEEKNDNNHKNLNSAYMINNNLKKNTKAIIPLENAEQMPRLQLSPEVSVSKIAVGGLHFPELETAANMLDYLHACQDLGITTLDLADIYGYNSSAELVGAAFALEDGLREKFEIVYKTGIVFPDNPIQYVNLSPEYLENALDIAFTQLNTDYIDIFMPHVPDLLVNVKEITTVFKKMKDSGKVKAFGVSDFSVSMFNLFYTAMQKAELPLVIYELENSILTPTPIVDGRYDRIQEINLIYGDDENALAAMVWGPLGGCPVGGPNRLFLFDGERQINIRDMLNEVGDELGMEEDQVAVAWLLLHPTTQVIVLGTTKQDRLKSQSSVIVDDQYTQMTRAQWTKLMAASSRGKEYSKWEQLHSGQWHDIINDRKNIFGTPASVDVPEGFCGE